MSYQISVGNIPFLRKLVSDYGSTCRKTNLGYNYRMIKTSITETIFNSVSRTVTIHLAAPVPNYNHYTTWYLIQLDSAADSTKWAAADSPY